MAKAQKSPEDMLTTSDAGVELGISPQRVLVLISTGRLRAVRFGDVWAIRRSDLDPVRIRKPGRKPKNPDEKKPDPKKKLSSRPKA